MSEADADNRAELARFLRRRRAEIDPRLFDLPLSARRRATGLLREEVAALAGVSTAWYTFLEQAREIRPSPDTLDRIADVFGLDDPERAYLHRLAFGLPQPGRTDPAADAALAHTIVAALAAVPYPVYAADVTGRMIAWNAATTEWYTDFSRPETRRNMIWWFWTDPGAHQVFPDWANEAADIAGRMRNAYAVPEFRAEMEPVVTEVAEVSPEFARAWASYTPTDHLSRPRRLRHREHGERVFQLCALFPVTGRRMAILMHTPIGRRESTS